MAPVAAVAGSVTNDAAGAAGTGLSHFECYTASAVSSASFRATAHQVVLKNGFGTQRFSAAPGAVRMQCNPAHQTTRSGVTPIKNPAAHLLCWAIKPTGAALPPLVTVTNDFGTGALKPIAARSLCVPSWTSKTRKVPSATAPSGLDTYVCYAVVHPAKTPAFHSPSKVVLADQFGTATRKIFAPNLVCVATSKSHAGAWTRIINPTDLAVCFATTSAAKPVRTVHDKNQFGTGAVKLTRSTEVCLPSLKASVTPPNTATTTTTTTPTTTTAPTTTTTSYVPAGLDAVVGFADLVVLAAPGNRERSPRRHGLRRRRVQHDGRDRRRAARHRARRSSATSMSGPPRISAPISLRSRRPCSVRPTVSRASSGSTSASSR